MSKQAPNHHHSSLPHTPADDATHVPYWWHAPFTKIAIALVTLAITLGLVNANIHKYETHLTTGETVLLELAPVDPRGFMQGDYMALRFALGEQIREAVKAEDGFSSPSAEGYAIVKVDNNGVGQLRRVVHGADADGFDVASLPAGEMAIHYRLRQGRIKFATNAFFFQEGHAKAYEKAEYGLFRVNDSGEPLLVDMVDEQFAVIEGE